MLALIALLVAGAAAVPVAPEMRGLWVVRTALVAPEDTARVLDQAQQAGINTLFVQVRGRGDAFYRSAIVPRSQLLYAQDPRRDPFGDFLDEAHRRGFKVHAWVNVLLVAHFSQKLPPDHVVSLHPEWLMLPRSLAHLGRTPARAVELMRQQGVGESEGLYLSPSAPGVAEHLEAVVAELLRNYALDGLHFDFIRYPSDDYDYSEAALQAFQRWQGNRAGPLEVPARSGATWGEFRRASITGLVARLSQRWRRERPGLPVSAAVIADWAAWLGEGLLDALCPMAYTDDPGVFRSQVERAVGSRGNAGAVTGRGVVWAGVGAYRLKVDQIIRNIHTARALGAAGVVLFSHESLARRDLERLRTLGFGVPPTRSAMTAAAPVGRAPQLAGQGRTGPAESAAADLVRQPARRATTMPAGVHRVAGSTTGAGR